jgi:hypothetical protein
LFSSSSSSSSSFFFCSNYFAFWQRSIINPPNMHTREREKIACVNHKSTSPTKACPSTCFFLVPHNKLKMMGKEEKRSTNFNQGSIIYISNEEERKEKKKERQWSRSKSRERPSCPPESSPVHGFQKTTGQQQRSSRRSLSRSLKAQPQPL